MISGTFGFTQDSNYRVIMRLKKSMPAILFVQIQYKTNLFIFDSINDSTAILMNTRIMVKLMQKIRLSHRKGILWMRLLN